MNQDHWSQVDAYFSATLVPSDDVLDAALAASDAAGLPAINVAPNQGTAAATARDDPRRGGFSRSARSAATARSGSRARLPPGGSLVTLGTESGACEGRDAEHRACRVRGSRDGGGRQREGQPRAAHRRGRSAVRFHLHRCRQGQQPGLSRRAALKLSRPGTVIVVDNVVRGGRVADPDNHEPDVVGVRDRFARLVAAPNLTTTAVQTVGQKGWDGFSISIVGA